MRLVMTSGEDLLDQEIWLREKLNVSVTASTCNHTDLIRARATANRIELMVRKYESTIGFLPAGPTELNCISLLDRKVRHRLLYVNVVYRSQDIFASQPGNVVTLDRIRQEIASKLRIGIGALTLHILSAHIYHRDFSQIRRILDDS